MSKLAKTKSPYILHPEEIVRGVSVSVLIFPLVQVCHEGMDGWREGALRTKCRSSQHHSIVLMFSRRFFCTRYTSAVHVHEREAEGVVFLSAAYIYWTESLGTKDLNARY